MKRSIFWFRRDLRVEDNIGLYNAIKNSYEIIPIFIFDEDILNKSPKNDQRLGFLIELLKKLEQDLKKLGSYLLVLKGKREEVIKKLVQDYDISGIYTNKSYSLSTIKLDNNVKAFCEDKNIDFLEYEDSILVPINKVPVRKVFTPFYKLWQKEITDFDNNEISIIKSPKIDIIPLENIIKDISYSESKYWKPDFIHNRLDNFNFEDYKETRNFPDKDGTSKISPYIRFGNVSIRKIYQKTRISETFVSELAWREFWYHIIHHFPETENIEFQEKRRNIAWLNNEKHLEAWQEGKTGYPIVDAGMRQLKEEGWMHNRVRMIVASFLTKDLIIDWREGEKHFAKYLIDYDENVNIGNWQWSSSVGADPKPLRIFSPFIQSEKFDPDCVYIKKYIPELKNESNDRIHNPIKYKLNYFSPIVDHSEMIKITKSLYMNYDLD
ncbi:MAG: deoxyribodipyrimidine photo-lyase [Candidatus Sericytochromatia bacterium]